MPDRNSASYTDTARGKAYYTKPYNPCYAALDATWHSSRDGRYRSRADVRRQTMVEPLVPFSLLVQSPCNGRRCYTKDDREKMPCSSVNAYRVCQSVTRNVAAHLSLIEHFYKVIDLKTMSSTAELHPHRYVARGTPARRAVGRTTVAAAPGRCDRGLRCVLRLLRSCSGRRGSGLIPRVWGRMEWAVGA